MSPSLRSLRWRVSRVPARARTGWSGRITGVSCVLRRYPLALASAA